MKNSLEKWVTIFLLSVSIFISVLLVEAIALALVNQFKTVFIYFSFIPALILSIFFFLFIKKDVKILPKISFPLLLLIFLVSIIMIFYPHDTFGGTDQAIYSNLASHLVNSSSFKISPYLNNLPGNYVENIRTWYQGYPVWLGIHFALFGTQWMLRSNVILIMLGLSSFFLVASYFGGNKIGLIATTLFSSSMPFLWFSRETMSENLSFFLLWTIVLFLLFFLKTKKYIYLILVFICSWLFGLTRFEGFLLQFVLLLILLPLLFLSKIRFKKILATTTFYIIMLVSNIYITKDIFLPIFFKVFVPSVSFSIRRDISSLIPKNLLNNNFNYLISDADNETLFNKLPFFYFQMMAKYNFILIIFSIFLVTFQFLVRLKRLDESKKFFFIILIIFLPEFYKLISPNIAFIQPWLYRRYMYALLPLGYLCFSLLLSQLINKKLLIVLSSSLLIINIFLSGPILFLKNNWILVDKITVLTEGISQRDLILIDYRSPLKYYDIRAFLVLEKGIRTSVDWEATNYKFIPEQKTFNGIPYEKIFFLSSSIINDKHFPFFKIVKIREIDVDYAQLVPSCELYLLREKEGIVEADIYNYEMITLSSANKYCSQPKNEIKNYKEKLSLYELIYENT